MILLTATAAPFYKNAFLVGCDRTRRAVLIDPGDEVEDLIRASREHQLEVERILLTHAHLDHITGVGRAKEVFGAPIYLHAADVPLYDAVVEQGRMFGLNVAPQPPVDRYYEPGGVLRFGDYEVRVHHTPGHSPGGVCLQVGPHGQPALDLFVGDTLFAGSIGRTDLPGGDHTVLIQSIRNVLFAFGDEARVYPGHGAPTTIGRERRTNPFLLE
ncbi:MAG TPA: MBL fold metallo-hydrolase [Vicinamibacterales bacterium]|nr:MBL fold metallo-hydrolase [Vicinamibacterales bacterium]